MAGRPVRFLMGSDEYGLGSRRVGVDISAGHVLISVEVTSGARYGEALLTPGQARCIAAELENMAKLTEAQTYLMDSETGKRI